MNLVSLPSRFNEQIDRIIHEPSRLFLMVYLYSVESADFTFLKTETGMTQGNLSSHLQKLESAGYVEIDKQFRRKRPLTMVRLTDRGRSAFAEYIRRMHLFFSDMYQWVE